MIDYSKIKIFIVIWWKGSNFVLVKTDVIVETVVFILIQVLYNYRNSRNIIFELTHVMHVCFKLPF